MLPAALRLAANCTGYNGVDRYAKNYYNATISHESPDAEAERLEPYLHSAASIGHALRRQRRGTRINKNASDAGDGAIHKITFTMDTGHGQPSFGRGSPPIYESGYLTRVVR